MIYSLLQGDNIEILKGIEADSVDAVITDPPYGIKFMNKKWDYDIPSVELWKEIIRVLKPGGHILVACGTRTQHRMAVNIEDAGFEIRDVICWHYGTGFPKSMDIGKFIDKVAGAIRPILKTIKKTPSASSENMQEGWKRPWATNHPKTMDITSPATTAAKQWDGWGTALKPATEFWTLARKPLDENTVAANIIKHGTGGLNIDECRIELNRNEQPYSYPNGAGGVYSKAYQQTSTIAKDWNRFSTTEDSKPIEGNPLGRFPANCILDEFMAAEMDKQSGNCSSPWIDNPNKPKKGGKTFGGGEQKTKEKTEYRDSGGASRFFYVPKSSTKERNEGLKDIKNNHPTVKPIILMRYLIKLITPINGTILDPFNGSGTTGCAAMMQGMNYIGIEKETEYMNISKERIEYYKKEYEIKNDCFG